jgi:tRNA(Ile2) C34 agmatinyltransferase TiaS
MTTATMPRIEFPFVDHAGSHTPSRSGGDGLTLGQALAGVWEGLASTGAVECPICSGAMVASGQHSGVCRDCGTRLS